MNLESGGVFASSSSISMEQGQGQGFHQLVMEFQLNGGNSWAQCRCYGFKRIGDSFSSTNGSTENTRVQIVTLGVSNMDASLNGGWAEVKVPQIREEINEDSFP